MGDFIFAVVVFFLMLFCYWAGKLKGAIEERHKSKPLFQEITLEIKECQVLDPVERKN